jgi:hypothetical protein
MSKVSCGDQVRNILSGNEITCNAEAMPSSEHMKYVTSRLKIRDIAPENT